LLKNGLFIDLVKDFEGAGSVTKDEASNKIQVAVCRDYPVQYPHFPDKRDAENGQELNDHQFRFHRVLI
jgi:hypothetical protein